MGYDNGVNLLSIAAPIFPLLNINPVTHFLYFEFILGKQMGNNIILFLLSLFSILNLVSCDTTEPPNNNNNGQDTTSQDFTFENFEFGDRQTTSYFNDVWIFDENNIWAVGYISPTDTTINGKYITNPNIIKWDGISWKLQPFSGTSNGIDGIWALDTSLIYFANGIVVKYQNGNYKYENFNNVPLSNSQRVEKLWGSAENNIWGVGPWGTVVHYNGFNWQKNDFDTQWYFYDITGNPNTGIAYASATNNQDIRIIVELNISTPNIIHQSEQITAVKSDAIKFIGYFLYNAGSDFSSTLLWKLDISTGRIDSLFVLNPTIAINRITGEKNNDIFYWGDDYGGNNMTHFNGIRYKTFNLFGRSYSRGGAHTKDDISVVVGSLISKGYITVVTRR